METDGVGTSIVFVPLNDVKKVIEKLTGNGHPAEEASPEELKENHPKIELCPGYTGVRIWHDPVMPVEEIMASTSLKRVI